MKKMILAFCVAALLACSMGVAGCSAQTGEAQSDESAPAQAEVPAAEPAEEPAGKYKDGTYAGVARGYKKGLNVEVTVENGLIADIRVTDNNEDEPYLTDSLVIIPEIIETQSTDVDAIAGATKTCEGISLAVEDALSQAE